MKLNQLEALVAIADGKGIAGAAEKLHISQPAITKSLAKLEHELGVALLDRSEYRLKLSVFGEKLLTHARAISSEVAMARREIKLLKETGQEVVRLNASPGVMPKLIPEALQRTRQTMPEVVIEISGEISAVGRQKFTDLAEGVYDLLIYPIEKSDNMDRFWHKPLLEVDMVVMASQNHPATRLKRPRLTDLMHYEWLMPAKAGLPIRLIQDAFYDAGLKLPARALGLPIRQMLFSCLHSGEYLAFVPSHPAILEDDAKKFPVIDIDMTPLGWTIYVIQRESTVPTLATTAFIDALYNLIKESEQG